MNKRPSARQASNAITPEHILVRHNPIIRRTTKQLRKIIRAAAPEAAEIAYPGWHAIGYRDPECGYFCGLFPGDDHVKLIFEFGVLLEDPFGVLEGEGKQVRQITYRCTKDIQVEPINVFIAQALRVRVRKQRKR